MTAAKKTFEVNNWGIILQKKINLFFHETKYCDLTLQFNDNTQIKVHRLVLNTCTDYFKVLENSLEIYDSILIMPKDLQADVIGPIVNFIYTGKIEFDLNMYDRLIETVNKMKIDILLKFFESVKKMNIRTTFPIQNPVINVNQSWPPKESDNKSDQEEPIEIEEPEKTPKIKFDYESMQELIVENAENIIIPWFCLRCGIEGRQITMINVQNETINEKLCEHCGYNSQSNNDLIHQMPNKYKIESESLIENTAIDEVCLNNHTEYLNEEEIIPNTNQNKCCLFCHKKFSKKKFLASHLKENHKQKRCEESIKEISNQPLQNVPSNMNIEILSDISISTCKRFNKFPGRLKNKRKKNKSKLDPNILITQQLSQSTNTMNNIKDEIQYVDFDDDIINIGTFDEEPKNIDSNINSQNNKLELQLKTEKEINPISNTNLKRNGSYMNEMNSFVESYKHFVNTKLSKRIVFNDVVKLDEPSYEHGSDIIDNLNSESILHADKHYDYEVYDNNVVNSLEEEHKDEEKEEIIEEEVQIVEEENADDMISVYMFRKDGNIIKIGPNS